MDVVIQFAIHKLGFQLSDIVIYAWSIGGFTGTKRQEQYKRMILIVPLWFCLSLIIIFCLSVSVSFLSQLGSDVIPRDPVSCVGCLL